MSAFSAPLSEKMTIEELGQWLVENGFSEDIRQCFEREEMDGEAIFGAFGCQAGPDCLKDILPRYGQRIKVYRAIKLAIDMIHCDEPKESSLPPSGLPKRLSKEASASPRSEHFSNQSEDSSADTYSGAPSPSSQKSNRSQTKRPPNKACKLPDPFIVPVFRDSTEENLAKEIYYPDDRKYIVRVLGTMILTTGSRATTDDCDQVAKALVRKFPFLKEYQSWSHYIYVRCQNVNRKPVGEETKPKKPKVEEKNMHHSYPPLQGEPEDEHTHAKNMQLLRNEITSGRPAGNINVKQLMSRTFLNRRDWITSSELPIKDILEEYKPLRKIPHIAHEMDMICNIEKSSSLFEENWKKYVSIILKYSKTVQAKEIKAALENLDSFDDDNDFQKEEEESLAALKCTAYFLVAKNKKKDKKGEDNYAIPYLLREVPNSTSMNEYLDDSNSFPYTVRLYDGDSEVASTYAVIVEGDTLTKCRDLTTALYVTFAAHYIFDISYHVRVKELFRFFQEVVMEIVDSEKKSAAFSSFCCAITGLAVADQKQ